ncbi:uncharacterized protein [Phyllobates terribilis]|uniref:uncharacterized protein isoform X2 n=1 Tax=Phyllobates terribilis TaxID=111132 RepID=UPI003CCB53F5
MDLYLAILGLTLPSLMGFASGKEMCDYPSDLSITNLTSEKFLVGSQLAFSCDPDYFAGFIDHFSYICDNSNGVIRWMSQDCHCHKVHGRTTNIQIGKDSSNCEEPTNMNETITKDYCGPIPSVINAQLDLSESKFPVGQELHYRLQCDHLEDNRTHGVLRCQDSSGSVDWIKLYDECIDKSKGSHPNNIGSHGKCNGSHPVEVTDCTGGGFARCVSFAVGVISVILVIWAIFKITHWKLKSTGKAKLSQRNTALAQKEGEMNAAHVPLNKNQ